MKLKVGDKIIIDKEKATLSESKLELPSWYSSEVFTIMSIENNKEVAILDRNLPNNGKNRIHFSYLKSVVKERKNKLLKLKSL